MTTDQRLDRLVERHEALAESVQSLTLDVHALTESIQSLTNAVSKLIAVMESHENRIARLEGSEGDELTH